MAQKPIQEQFGQQVIEAFAGFARCDLRTPAELEGLEFSHISDSVLRKRLSEVFYGVRWIYKLGLALLTKDVERAAHVRSQIVDYASVVEGVLSHCLAHAIRKGYTQGSSYNFRDPDVRKQAIKWNTANPEQMINRQSFWWFIKIAEEFGIVNTALAKELHWLRVQRNSVHLRQKSSLGNTAFLNQSKKAFEIASQALMQTKKWKTSHP